MKQIFPIEIQENSVQSLWVRRYTKTKIIYLVIIIALITIIVLLPFIYVDVSIQSRGVIRSLNENNIIQSAIYAEVEKTDIFENKSVIIGDTLIWLRDDELDEQIYRLNGKISENNLFLQDLKNLLSLSYNNILSPKYQSELAQFKAKLTEQSISISQAQTDYNTSKTLYEKGVEAETELQKVESNYKTLLSQKELIQQQQVSEWQAEKTRLEYENKDYNSQIQQYLQRKKQYILTAPISGNIVQYNGIQTGNFIQSGQSIAQISTSDTLLIECYISPVDIGYTEKGQKVVIQVDAYNYQQWGLLEGEVSEVLPDIVEVNNTPCFRVRSYINRNYLELDNGYKGYVKKGMTITGRFFLTKRSLSQLLFDKIDNWMNPKIVSYGNKN